jgi:hypothetical protein
MTCERSTDHRKDHGDTMDAKEESELHGDYAGSERTKALTPTDEQSALLEGDFASGERTIPLTEEQKLEAGLHGDFAGSERTEPLTAEDDVPGSFAPDKK